MNTSMLSRAQVEEFDPHGPPNRRWCPLCGEGKPRDSAHRCLSVDSEKGLYFCFRCGAKGRFQDERTANEFPNRRQIGRERLRRAFEISLPSELQAPQAAEKSEWREWLQFLEPLQGTVGEAYLQSRGLSLEVAANACVKWSPNWAGRGAVVFPLYDAKNGLVAAQGRYCEVGATPKARTYGPKKEGAFFTARFEAALRGGAPLIITEAPLDALSLAQCGFAALALCGTSGPRWIHLKCGLRTVFLAFDADEAGDRAAHQLTEILAPFGAHCHRLRPEAAKDWNDVLQRDGASNLGDWLIWQTMLEE